MISAAILPETAIWVMNKMPEITAINNRTLRIAVIGLGYVGLPLAAAFGKIYPTIGLDLKPERIKDLRDFLDSTGEVSAEELRAAEKLSFTGNADALKDCDVFIVTVPTPVDRYNRPDLTLLLAASRTVGKNIRQGGLVIFESTVYPGCTEEDCVPVIEQESGLKFNTDFFAGYSPERINPGDPLRKLQDIGKVVSGSTEETADFVESLYRSILRADVYRAPSIKVAEAAKVIENSQRDLNIAFVNELAKICRLLEIDTHDVLDAAGTKWNFLKFQPGLVGGHCIGVDPYYLTHKAQALGYLPEVILAGRRINDGMGRYVASEIVKLMIRKGLTVLNAKVLQLGITFKENCRDIRNSHAVDVVRALEDFGCTVDVCDPLADPEAVAHEYGIMTCKTEFDSVKAEDYSVIIMAVAHKEFQTFPFELFAGKDHLIYDIKGVVPRNCTDGRL